MDDGRLYQCIEKLCDPLVMYTGRHADPFAVSSSGPVTGSSSVWQSLSCKQGQ